MQHYSLPRFRKPARFISAALLSLCAWTLGASAQQPPDPFRLVVREQFFKSLVEACSRLHGDDAQRYQERIKGWQAQNREQLESAMRALMQKDETGSERLSKALEAERFILEDWQTNQMKIPLQRAPTKAECDRMLESLPGLGI